MKVNKKAILGMFVAMVMSLGIITGINQKNSILKDANLVQISLGCAVNGATAEGAGSQTAWKTASVVAGAGAGFFYKSAVVTGATGVGAPVAVANALLGGICTL